MRQISHCTRSKSVCQGSIHVLGLGKDRHAFLLVRFRFSWCWMKATTGLLACQRYLNNLSHTVWIEVIVYEHNSYILYNMFTHHAGKRAADRRWSTDHTFSTATHQESRLKQVQHLHAFAANLLTHTKHAVSKPWKTLYLWSRGIAASTTHLHLPSSTTYNHLSFTINNKYLQLVQNNLLPHSFSCFHLNAQQLLAHSTLPFHAAECSGVWPQHWQRGTAAWIAPLAHSTLPFHAAECSGVWPQHWQRGTAAWSAPSCCAAAFGTLHAAVQCCRMQRGLTSAPQAMEAPPAADVHGRALLQEKFDDRRVVGPCCRKSHQRWTNWCVRLTRPLSWNYAAVSKSQHLGRSMGHTSVKLG